MDSQLYRGLVFALYQFSLLLGIVLLPVALVLGRMGVTLPIHKAVLRLENAYTGATSS